jgi:hypothetical protein
MPESSPVISTLAGAGGALRRPVSRRGSRISRPPPPPRGSPRRRLPSLGDIDALARDSGAEPEHGHAEHRLAAVVA